MEASSLLSSNFLVQWRKICALRKADLVRLWSKLPEYTSEIFYTEKSLVSCLAGEFGLSHYCNYYSLDAVFFDKEMGRVHCCPDGQTWIQRIRIAFEHEHSFCSGLFKEVSHLCITRADLRVLVTYPEGRDVTEEFKNLAKIVEAADLPATDQPFLIITGQKIHADTDIEWIGYTYQAGEFLPLKS